MSRRGSFLDVVFSTIHKAKGLEADRIFLIRTDLMLSKYAVKGWEIQQERNCIYVALARAKKEMTS